VVGGPGSAIEGPNLFSIHIYCALLVLRHNQEIVKSHESDRSNDISKNIKKPEDLIKEQPKNFLVLVSCECTFVITGIETTGLSQKQHFWSSSEY
jgi:hypothetical protein